MLHFQTTHIRYTTLLTFVHPLYLTFDLLAFGFTAASLTCGGVTTAPDSQPILAAAAPNLDAVGPEIMLTQP